ncbi:MAG: hypothetical protein H7836_11120 [Magnetococcus sp. YQC-3]
MKNRIHALAGVLAMLTIATFWLSTLIAELFLSIETVVWVKQSIVTGIFVLIPLLMITGGSGFSLARGSTHPSIAQKRRRMPFIALNGLLILLPAAFYLSWQAQTGMLDGLFYGTQAVELLAGAVNLWLMSLNLRDGMQLRQRIDNPAG